jgi:uncharacterized spore protein YtfJ
MKIEELMSNARDTVSVKRVFAEPYEKDGVTIIAAASVAGGAGGGSGHDDHGQEGEGGGIGMAGRPAGAYVIKEGNVMWRPAVDVNRLLAVLGAVLVTYLLTRPRLVRARAKAARVRAARAD